MYKYDLKIVPTIQCNQRCAYCWQKEYLGGKIEEKLDQHIDDIVNLIKTDMRNIKIILLIGGETYLSLDFIIKMLKRLHDILIPEYGIVVKLETNGTIFNDKVIEMYDVLKTVPGYEIYMADHNLQYANPKSIFRKHLDYCVSNNLKCYVKYVLDKRLFNNPQRVYDIVNNYPYLDIIFLIAYYNPKSTILTEDVDKMMEFIRTLDKDDKFTRLLRESAGFLRFKCGEGINELSVYPDGYLYSCDRGKSNPINLHITEVSSMAEIRLKNSKFASLLNNYFDVTECDECDIKKYCVPCDPIFFSKEEACSYAKVIEYLNIQINK